MPIVNWNKWRTDYNKMTTEEQKKFHNEVEQAYPKQKHYHHEYVEMFFNKVFETERNIKVFEAGGWKGDLAEVMLVKYPNILLWKNIEICESASQQSICKDNRYRVEVPEKFKWWEDCIIDSEVFIASHFIEHLSDEDLCGLFQSIKSKYIYLESPLTVNGQSWDGYVGTHMLSMGWDAVLKSLPDYQLMTPVVDRSIYTLRRQDNE